MKIETTEHKKTIGIVTLYKAFNHGAFLQAYALQKILKENDFTVLFIDIYNINHNLLTLKTLKPSKRFFLKSAIFNLQKFLIFRKFQKTFRAVNKKNNNFSAVILGSDEIWNVKNSTFLSSPAFFGLDVNTSLIISYAPSAAQSTSEDIIKNSQLADGIKRIEFCSARDKNALDIIKNITGKDGLRVLDPTFLTNIEDEYLDIGYKKFIVVYSYGLSPSARNDVQAFAKKKGLPIISLGFYADWCDKSVNANPFQFMNILKRAEYVVTDTFHGTVLSVQLNKNLAVYAAGKEKIEDFLYTYKLSHRMVHAENSIDNVLNTKINSNECTLIDKQLEISQSFLISALSKIFKGTP